MEITDYETIKTEMILSDFEFVKGYENLYKINKIGEVYSVLRSKVLKYGIHEDGYLFVILTKESKRTKCYIHRLVALQWIENPEDKKEVDHIDRNPKNNNLENLRWATHTENANNKSNNLKLLSEEELEQKKKELKEYKRVWAENKRREKGIKPRSEMTKTKDPEYYNKLAKEKRDTEDSEAREARLQKRRDAYAKKKEEERLRSAILNHSTEL
jgi:hypothetical protein